MYLYIILHICISLYIDMFAANSAPHIFGESPGLSCPMAHHGPIALHQDFDLLFAVGVRVWILARHDGPRATRIVMIVPGTELVLEKKTK